MAKTRSTRKPSKRSTTTADAVGTGDTTKAAGRPSSLLDTRVIYCGDCLDQLKQLPACCIDLIDIDPPFNSNHNYEASGLWGETKEKRAFEDRHASTQAYIDYMRPRCVELARVLHELLQVHDLQVTANAPADDARDLQEVAQIDCVKPNPLRRPRADARESNQ